MSEYHIPVLKQKSIDYLIQNPDGIYIDATFGGGGFTKEILSRISKNSQVFAFDLDKDSKKESKKIKNNQFFFINDNFINIKKHLLLHNINQVDGIVADLGVSSHQIDNAERGFSFRFDSKIDMRMDITQQKSAIDIINNYSFEELANIFQKFGELKNSKKIAQFVIDHRLRSPIKSTKSLLDALNTIIPYKNRHKTLAKIFQSIRIEVNDELNNLKKLLKISNQIIKKDGRLVILSYHSLEDRLVKRYLKTGNFDNILNKDFYGNVVRPFNPLFLKPIKATEDEIIKNNRSRSVKLRVGEKC